MVNWSYIIKSFQFSLQGFTDMAVEVLALARQRSAAVHHSSVTPEHLLFALATVERSVGRIILERLGLDLSRHLAEIEGLTDAIPVAESEGDPDLSKSTLDLLSQAKAHSRALGHNYVGTEHLVLGLLTVPSPASSYLSGKGVILARFREEAVKVLTGGP